MVTECSSPSPRPGHPRRVQGPTKLGAETSLLVLSFPPTFPAPSLSGFGFFAIFHSEDLRCKCTRFSWKMQNQTNPKPEFDSFLKGKLRGQQRPLGWG